jgi:hypothetical protein
MVAILNRENARIFDRIAHGNDHPCAATGARRRTMHRTSDAGGGACWYYR